MKILSLILFVALAGCQTYNSNSEDEAKFGPTDLVGSVEFVTAFPVIQNRCINCHSGDHDEWADYTNADDWVNAGANLVVAGDPDNSEFITKIFNHGSAGANMPLGGSPLPDAEYDKLVDWVTNGY